MAQENNIGRLLPISENNGIQAVSGRYLHSFLQSKQDFSTWIKNRIKQYGFVENVDYEVFHNSMENQSFAPQNYGAKRGGSNKVEYALSIDMAKELSMVERTERGRQARRYFIECEQTLKKQNTFPKEQADKYEKMLQESFSQIKQGLEKISKLENELWEEKARVVIETDRKVSEINTKNSMVAFLCRTKMYGKWQKFDNEQKLKETVNILKKRKEAEDMRPDGLPF